MSFEQVDFDACSGSTTGCSVQWTTNRTPLPTRCHSRCPRPQLSLVPERMDFDAAATDEEDDQWQERALCAQTDPEAFFPEKGGSTREAKRICLAVRCATVAWSTHWPTMSGSVSGVACQNENGAASSAASSDRTGGRERSDPGGIRTARPHG